MQHYTVIVTEYTGHLGNPYNTYWLAIEASSPQNAIVLARKVAPGDCIYRAEPYDPSQHYHTKRDTSTWWEHDARGYELARVCDVCRPHKLAKYRSDVLTDPNYPTCEQIEED